MRTLAQLIAELEARYPIISRRGLSDLEIEQNGKRQVINLSPSKIRESKNQRFGS